MAQKRNLTVDKEQVVYGDDGLPHTVTPGKDAKGRFLPGNKIGHKSGGSSIASMASTLRTALVKSVSTGDMKEIMQAMVRRAKEGDSVCARVVLGYTVGEPQPYDLIERICYLEEMLKERDARYDVVIGN
jgi:hypothetical protein